MMRAVRVVGEYRVETPDGSLVGPDTVQDGFNGPLLRALREHPTAIENDSVGYVWPTREAAERAVRYAHHRCGKEL